MEKKLRPNQKGSHGKTNFWFRSQCIMTVIIHQNKTSERPVQFLLIQGIHTTLRTWSENAFPATPVREPSSQQELRSCSCQPAFLSYPAQNLISLLSVTLPMLGGFEVLLFIRTTFCQWRAWRNSYQLNGNRSGLAGLKRQKSVTLNWG